MIRSLYDLNKELEKQLIIEDEFIEEYNKKLKELLNRGIITENEFKENFIEY